MAYTDQAGVVSAAGGISVLIDLTDQDGTGAGQVDAAVLAKAIVDVGGMIDSYVAKQRAVPLNPVPAVIALKAAQEVVFLLRSQKPRAPIGELELSRHEENIKWLEGVARGTITLGVDPQPAKSSLVTSDIVTVSDADTEITACNTRGFW